MAPSSTGFARITRSPSKASCIRPFDAEAGRRGRSAEPGCGRRTQRRRGDTGGAGLVAQVDEGTGVGPGERRRGARRGPAGRANWIVTAPSAVSTTQATNGAAGETT